MRSVHFGAGNIGRGFIGQVLNRAGYEITFVDVQAGLVDALRKERRYDVILADESGERIPVGGVTALHSEDDAEAVVERVAGADLVTTAVGPNVLPAISGIIAEGLAERVRTGGPPVNVIACENMVGGSEALRGYVMQHVPEEKAGDVERVAAFPNSAVDRIVPEQSNAGLDVSVEPFYEWTVETSRIKGDRPDIEGVTYVDDLAPYIERKLFTVNTGHAAVAYLGYSRGLTTISESVEDDSLREEVSGVLEETGRLLIHKHGFDEGEHDWYKQKILSRFRNPHISDEVTRVARMPIRKLGREERLVSPALQLLERGVEPVHLAGVVGAALRYDDSGDEEAVELQRSIRTRGEGTTLAQYADISEDHPLVELLLKEMEKR